MRDEVLRLFREVDDLTPAERALYFEKRQVPADLKAELESLLQFDAPDTPMAEMVTGAAQAFLESLEEFPEPGLRCGPYRLERLLGRGGAGEVFLAERADGQVEQLVAIKLLCRGVPRASLRSRFLQERQILARLQHSGIARLLDVGETAEGRPYLVMDYIDGVPIDVYSQELDVRGRLRLFLGVCDAVAYAHRNLIIHRDIKPSNILVDEGGQPKLLDFGIAKILAAASDQTRTQERVLTPDYASPEQVRGEAQSTATDIYSLGAVLYRLLTGQSPHAFPESYDGSHRCRDLHDRARTGPPPESRPARGSRFHPAQSSAQRAGGALLHGRAAGRGSQSLSGIAARAGPLGQFLVPLAKICAALLDAGERRRGGDPQSRGWVCTSWNASARSRRRA